MKKTTTPIQGSLWCRACNGSGKYLYRKGQAIKLITCPLCKGLKVDTFKGKANNK